MNAAQIYTLGAFALMLIALGLCIYTMRVASDALRDTTKALNALIGALDWADSSRRDHDSTGDKS